MSPPSMQLPVKLYDGIWMDCIHNHLLAILSKQNPSYMNMNLNLRRSYTVCRSEKKGELSEDFKRQVIYPGYLVLDVKLEFPKFGSGVIMEDFGPFEDHMLHELIQESLLRSRYVFIKLDRFFIPNNKNYGKNHFANVALIYGYDHNSQCYSVLNDYRLSRTYEAVELPYDVVYQAYHESTDFERVFFHTEMTEAAIQADIRVSRDKVLANLTSMLDTRIKVEEGCEWPGLERMFGVEAIREYAEGFTAFFPYVMADYLPAVYNGPLDAAKLNLLILDALEQDKHLSALQSAKLKLLYGELRTMWELYRNKIYMYVARVQANAHGTSPPDLVGTQKQLFQIYAKEKEATELFLETLQSSMERV